jgi:hypothetical protein
MSHLGIATRRTTQPQVVCQIDKATVGLCCRMLATRIREIVRARGVSVMLFIDRDGNARIVHEDHPASETWFRDRFAEYVGMYRIGTHANTLDASIEGVTEDVTHHLGY